MFIRFTARAFRKLMSIYVFSYFPFGFEGRIWDQIVSVPDHCLPFYFAAESRMQLECMMISHYGEEAETQMVWPHLTILWYCKEDDSAGDSERSRRRRRQ